MLTEGWAQPASPTILAGTPATVLQGGTSCEHDGPGGDAAAIADLDVAEHLGARADQNAVADLGVTVLLFLAGAAEGHGMQHGDVVAHDRRFADDDGMGVVDHDPAADAGGRVDVDAEDFRAAHLQEIGQILAPLPVQSQLATR